MIENYLKRFTLRYRGKAMRYVGVLMSLLLFSGIAKAQYCASANTDPNPQGSLLANVTFGTISNTTGAIWTSPSGYNYYTSQTTSVIMGSTENLSVTIDAAGAYSFAIVSVWIDWDQDQLLEVSEWLQVGTNITSGTTATISVPIPSTATPGITRMRIRSRGATPNGASDACLSMGSGETEDYDISVVPATSCTATPVAGAAVTTTPNVCPGVAYSVSLSGATIASGLDYQWEESPVGLNTWTAISGATNPNYSTTMTGDMDYHCIVTCTGIGTPVTSTPVTVSQNPFYNCYCASMPQYTNDGEIFNVTLGQLNNTSNCTQTGGPGSILNKYSDYTTLITPDTLYQDAAYPVSVTAGSCGGTYVAYVKVFIDLDHDGAFTTLGEEVFAGIPPGGFYTPTGVAATGIFTIPSGSSVTGLTRMRVIMQQASATSGASVTPCTNTNAYYYGETEDYAIYIPGIAPACGTVTAGTVTADKDSACTAESFTLVSVGYSSGQSGVTYQWEESAAGAGAWNPISNATNPFYTGTHAAGDYDYRLAVSCNSGTPAYSNTVSIFQNELYYCYCSPLTGNPLHQYPGTNYITYVEIPGTTLSNVSTASGTGGYTRYKANVASQTATVVQGTPYMLNVGILYSGYLVETWIDYDQSGTFDASEYTLFPGGPTATSPDTMSVPILIPYTSALGNIGMRIRQIYPPALGSANACMMDPDAYETEDYILTVTAAPACASVPVAPTVTQSVSSACLNETFALTATGISTGMGITYQWEESPVGTNTFSPITNATSPYFNGTQVADMDYRFVTVCSNVGGGTSYSDTLTVTMSPFYLCYCSPKTGTTLHNYVSKYITNVAIPGTTLNNPTPTAGPGSYTQYTNAVASQTASLTQGTPYTLNTTMNSQYSYGVDIWIDYDQSGTYDASEYINGGSVTSAGNLVISTPLMIPYTATAGLTGMRLRNYYNPYGASNACNNGNNNNGYETQDYVIDILTAISCVGTPVAADASGPSQACNATNFNISATGFGTGLGITYEWESSPTGTNTWAPIPGATGPSFAANQTAATDYRFVTTCSGGGISYSDTLVVAMSPFYLCYCASAPQYAGDEEIYNVTVNGISTPAAYSLTNACSVVAPGPGSLLDRYSNFTTLPVTIQLEQGSTVPFTVEENECNGASYYPFGTSIWIDFDQNGVFDPTDQVFTESATLIGPRNITGMIAIPSTAILGNTGMRVVINENVASPGPCSNSNYGYGETEDYTVAIIPPAACGAPTPLSAQNITTSDVDISWATIGTAVAYEYAIDQTNALAPTGTTTSTTSTGPITVSGLSSATTYYLHVRSDCGGLGYSSWAMISFTTAYPVPPNDDCLNAIDISNATSTNGYNVNGTQSQAPCGTGTTTAYDVWYSFTTGATAGNVTVTVNTTTTGMDAILETFSGSCGSLTTLTATSAGTSSSFTCIDGPAAGVETATYAVAANTTYYVRVYSYALTPTGTFAIQVTGSPLAIKLGKITATNVGASNRVEWNTLSEEATDKFELQRSADGDNFNTIANIDAKGQAHRYTYMDNAPVSGYNYYRLLMKEANGRSVYSQIVKAFVKTTGFTVEAFPNPVSQDLTVKVSGVQGSDAAVRVTDVTGKIVKTIIMSGSEEKINMSGLANGIYLIKYSDANHTQTIRVNKQ